MKVNKTLLFFLSLLCIGHSGCYDEIVDCLDPLATNFEPEADEDCCCTYPAITTRWEYKIGDNLYPLTDSIQSSFGYTYRLADFRMIGGMVWVRGDSLLDIGTTKLMILNDQGMQTRVERIDDAFYLNPNRFTQTFGEYRYSGMVDSLIFHLAPIDRFDQIDTISFENNEHPLRVAGQQGLWKQDNFCHLYFEIESMTDTIRQFVPVDDPIRISKPYAVDLLHYKGRTDTVELDFERFFENIDWFSMDSVAIGRQLTIDATEAIKLR